MKSFFVTGTDTDVGKTWITAGLAASITKMGIDVGVMKPFAAGNAQKTGFKSKDVEILSKAAQVNDDENLLNPQFFSIAASPYTASKELNVDINIKHVLDCFQQLSTKHEIMLVEGMGGIMTPILKNYHITNLIKDMNLDTIIITRSRVGTVNHTIMTCEMCVNSNIPVRGIIINDFDSDGYDATKLKLDLEDLTNLPVLGIIPRVENIDIQTLTNAVENNLDVKSLL